MSLLASEHLSIYQEELESVAGERDVWVDGKNGWMDDIHISRL